MIKGLQCFLGTMMGILFVSMLVGLGTASRLFQVAFNPEMLAREVILRPSGHESLWDNLKLDVQSSEDDFDIAEVTCQPRAALLSPFSAPDSDCACRLHRFRTLRGSFVPRQVCKCMS